jgi:hypothetical protein
MHNEELNSLNSSLDNSMGSACSIHWGDDKCILFFWILPTLSFLQTACVSIPIYEKGKVPTQFGLLEKDPASICRNSSCLRSDDETHPGSKMCLK